MALDQRRFQRAHLPPLPDRRREAMLDDVVLLAAPEAGHQQDAPGDTGLPQAYSFFRSRNPEPLRSRILEGERALHQAVSVGVGLDDGADGGAANVLLDGAEVMPQSVARDFSPGWSHLVI